MSLAGAVRWTLSSRIFTSMVSVGAPGMANSTTSLSFALSAYATVLGATLIRSSGILAPSFYKILFRNFHFDIRDATVYTQGPYIATAFSPHGSGTPLREQDPPPPGFSKTRNCLIFG